MLRFPRNLAMKRKITLVVLATSTACLVATFLLFAFHLQSVRRAFINDLSATGEILANSIIDSVALNDREPVEATLGGLLMPAAGRQRDDNEKGRDDVRAFRKRR